MKMVSVKNTDQTAAGKSSQSLKKGLQPWSGKEEAGRTAEQWKYAEELGKMRLGS